MDKTDRCTTCGRPRGLAQKRRSWGINTTVIVPRTGNPEDQPAQIANDLICNAAVWRNGGTCEATHLCDDCLRIGLRAIKVQIDALLGELDEGHDKEAEMADLTQRLARLQWQLHMACFEHNRMQDRLGAVLPHVVDADPEALHMARFEVNRGHLETDAS